MTTTLASALGDLVDNGHFGPPGQGPKSEKETPVPKGHKKNKKKPVAPVVDEDGSLVFKDRKSMIDVGAALLLSISEKKREESKKKKKQKQKEENHRPWGQGVSKRAAKRRALRKEKEEKLTKEDGEEKKAADSVVE